MCGLLQELLTAEKVIVMKQIIFAISHAQIIAEANLIEWTNGIIYKLI
jgi:hypothetical protein